MAPRRLPDQVSAAMWPYRMPVLLVAVLLLIAPHLFLDPRFWAEEGSLYYFEAMKTGPLSILAVHNGNYQVLTNVFAWLATLVDPLYAPAVTTLLATAVMGVVALQIGLALRDCGVRPGIASLVVVAWLLSLGELTANTTNVQWLGALSMLLLAVQNVGAWRRSTVCLVVLWVASWGMTGVPSALVSPVLLLRGLLTQSRRHIGFGCVLGVCAIAQVAIIFGSDVSNRSFDFGLQTLVLPAFMQSIYALLIGAGPTRFLARLAPDLTWALALLAMGIGALCALVYFSSNRAIALVLVVAFVLAGLVQTFGAIGPVSHRIAMLSPPFASRYFATGTLTVLFLIALVKPAPYVSAALLVLIFANLMPQAIKLHGNQRSEYPSWSEQVARCRGECTIALWPKGWSVPVKR